MRPPERETAAPVGAGNGGYKTSTPPTYPAHDLDSRKIAALVIADRYRIPPRMARLVCELAELGGRFA